MKNYDSKNQTIAFHIREIKCYLYKKNIRYLVLEFFLFMHECIPQKHLIATNFSFMATPVTEIKNFFVYYNTHHVLNYVIISFEQLLSKFS